MNIKIRIYKYIQIYTNIYKYIQIYNNMNIFNKVNKKN